MAEQPPRDTTGATHVGAGHYLRYGPAHRELWWSHPECRGWHSLVGHRYSLDDVSGLDSVTIHGSLLCPETGVHGWVTEGVWRDA